MPVVFSSTYLAFTENVFFIIHARQISGVNETDGTPALAV
jgi:hypothetical protein